MDHSKKLNKNGKRGTAIQKKGKLIRERRKHPRFNFKLPMNYTLKDSRDNYGGIIGNASEGGILVYLPEKLKDGEVLKIEILFAKEWELKTIRGIAKIVWSDLATRKSGRVYRYGLQFQLLNKGNLRQLGTLFKEAAKKKENRTPAPGRKSIQKGRG